MKKWKSKATRQLFAVFIALCMLLQTSVISFADSMPYADEISASAQDETGVSNARTYVGGIGIINRDLPTIAPTISIGNTYTERIVSYDVEISKKNIVGEEIGGAQIKITDARGNTVEEWTSEEGRSHSITVQPGTYTFHEEAAPTGYVAVTDITFTVDIDGDVTVIGSDDAEVDQNGKLVVTDEAIHFIVNKTDATGDTELVGAVIKIYEVDENGDKTDDALDTWYSAEDETHDFGAVLGAGKDYILEEETAPEGYTTIADTAFSVNNDGSITTTLETEATDEDGNPIYLVKDEYEDQIVVISKVNIGGREIGGAQIKITDARGNTVEEWTSEEGRSHSITVQPGTYTFHEEAAPTGYVAVTDITFTVDIDGDVTVIGSDDAEVDQNGKLVVTDEAIHFIVNKTDATGDTELVGAVIKIYEADENGDKTDDALDTWYSAEDETHDFGAVLGAGKDYILEEETAPEGYTTIADTAFSVNNDGSIKTTLETKATDEDGNPIYLVKDEYEDQIVVISKVNVGGREIGGAQIKITDARGNTVEEWTSEEGKSHSITVKPGTYIFHEEAAPTGYVAVTDITFTVDKTGTVTVDEASSNTANVDESGKLVITDRADETTEPDDPKPETPIHFVVNNTDKTDGKELTGGIIELYEVDENGNKVGETLDTWTSAEGETHDFGQFLEPGKSYVLTQTTPPDGYSGTEDTSFSVEEDGTVTTTLETKETDEDGNPIYLVENEPEEPDNTDPDDPNPDDPNPNDSGTDDQGTEDPGSNKPGTSDKPNTPAPGSKDDNTVYPPKKETTAGYSSNTPNTGDPSPIMQWAALCLGSIVAAGALARRKRGKYTN